MHPSLKRYVRTDRLLPGDVFLSRGIEKESIWIARCTFGPFSHAAIYDGFHCVFEAIDDGIGFTGLEIAKVCTETNRPFELLDVSNYRTLEIHRHPKLEQDCKTNGGRLEISDRLIEWMVPMSGLEYPALINLAKAVPYIPTFVVFPLLWVIARLQKEPPKVVPGLFCSQLVVRALEDLDASPLKNDFFNRTILPEKVSPNRLRSRLSRLKPVQGVIVDQKFNCNDDGSRQWYLNALKGQQSQRLNMLNKSRDQEMKIKLSHLNKQYEEVIAKIKAKH